MTKEECLAGLKSGRRLRCDRKDEPLLLWLLSHPDIEREFIQHDEQSSCIEFRWRSGKGGMSKLAMGETVLVASWIPGYGDHFGRITGYERIAGKLYYIVETDIGICRFLDRVLTKAEVH